MESRPNRSSKRKRSSRQSRQIKVMRYVVPPTRLRSLPAAQAMMVPTRWVKLVIALFLLPICAILSQTFFTVFTRVTVTQQLWAGEEFWFFSLGVVLWLIAFFGLPRPLLVYVFGHELTHALWVLLMGGRISQFQVRRDGGYIVTDRNNFWIALAPYFFPLYSIIALALYGGLGFFINVQPYGQLLYAVIGVTWAFHFTFTCWMIPKSQTDLTDNGTLFSLVFIYLMNLLLLSILLVVASPEISFADFGNEISSNLRSFFESLGILLSRFRGG